VYDNNKDYTMKTKSWVSGLGAGLVCAFIGSVTFSMIEFIKLGLKTNSFISISDNLISAALYMIFFMTFIGFGYSFIPGGTGGLILGIILQNLMHRGSLTPAKGLMAGILLAGLAILFTCGYGIADFSFSLISTQSIKYLIGEAVKQGTLAANLPTYLHDYLDLIIEYWFEILMAIVIACVSGDWREGI